MPHGSPAFNETVEKYPRARSHAHRVEDCIGNRVGVNVAPAESYVEPVVFVGELYEVRGGFATGHGWMPGHPVILSGKIDL